MWKNNASKGMAGTPSAFVNGVKLDSVPMSVAEWISLFDDVLAKQW